MAGHAGRCAPCPQTSPLAAGTARPSPPRSHRLAPLGGRVPGRPLHGVQGNDLPASQVTRVVGLGTEEALHQSRAEQPGCGMHERHHAQANRCAAGRVASAQAGSNTTVALQLRRQLARGFLALGRLRLASYSCAVKALLGDCDESPQETMLSWLPLQPAEEHRDGDQTRWGSGPGAWQLGYVQPLGDAASIHARLQRHRAAQRPAAPRVAALVSALPPHQTYSRGARSCDSRAAAILNPFVGSLSSLRSPAASRPSSRRRAMPLCLRGGVCGEGAGCA